MKIPPFYDLIGAVVTLVLLIAVIAYPLAGQAIPEELRTAFTVAIGWIFRGAAQAANDVYHQRRSANGS